MKGLILTMTCGEGHNAVAKAIKKEMESRKIEIVVVDIFQNHKFLHVWNNEFYFFGKKIFPKIADRMWENCARQDPNNRDSCKNQKFIKPIYKEIREVVIDGKFDFVICTHNFASTIITNMKKEGINLPPTYAILTDMKPHPFWEASIKVDYIITPTEDASEDLIRRGFKKEQIKPLGIPVAQKFSKIISKQEAQKQLNIPNKFTVIITSGGNGHYSHLPIFKAINDAKLDVTLLAVCGKNKKMKQSLDSYVKKVNNKNLLVFGFVDNIDIMLSSADLFITVGGCISMCEGIVKNVPLLFRENLIVNEKDNRDYILKKDLGFKITKPKEVVNVIKHLIDNNDILINIKKGLNEISKPNATKDIVDFITKVNLK